MSETSHRDQPGTLFGVGVGPGDPDLLTLKAVRVIRAADVIAVPRAKQSGDSYALHTVRGLLKPEKTIVRLHFPMVMDMAVRNRHRQRAAESIAAHLAEGRDVAFLTEGDPLFYSTFIYILEHMPDGTKVEIVPGITSVHAAAAQAQVPLVRADQGLAILPATAENVERLPAVLRLFHTVILVKLHRTLDLVVEALHELDITGHAVLVDRASHPSGRVVRDVGSLEKDGVHYMSLMILSKPDNETRA